MKRGVAHINTLELQDLPQAQVVNVFVFTTTKVVVTRHHGE